MTIETIERTHRGQPYRINIEYDDGPESPREWDNLGTMVCWHRRYNLGDEQPSCDPNEYLELLHPSADRFDDWRRYYDHADRRIEKIMVKFLDEHYVILSLYLYDHSGITMRTSEFSCPWDSGQVGFIYCSLEKAIENWGLPEGSTWNTMMDPEKHRFSDTLEQLIISCLQDEVKTYDHYLTGAVYGFTVDLLDPNDTDVVIEENVDSCWGFYGYDHEESGLLEMATNGAECEINYRLERAEAERREALIKHFDKLKSWIRHSVPLGARQPLEV